MSRMSTALQLLKLSAAYPRTAGLPGPKAAPSLSLLPAYPAKDAVESLAAAATVVYPKG